MAQSGDGVRRTISAFSRKSSSGSGLSSRNRPYSAAVTSRVDRASGGVDVAVEGDGEVHFAGVRASVQILPEAEPRRVGRHALTSMGESVARLWDLGTGEPRRRFELIGEVWGVAFRPDGRRASGGGGGASRKSAKNAAAPRVESAFPGHSPQSRPLATRSVASGEISYRHPQPLAARM